MSRALALSLLLSAAGGCVTNARCRDQTLLVTVDFGADADAADQLVVDVTVVGSGTGHSMVSHVPGHPLGTLEVDFPAGYRADARVVVEITASAQGRVVGAGHVTVTLLAGCSVAALTVTDDGGIADGAADLTGYDQASDLPDESVPIDQGVTGDAAAAADQALAPDAAPPPDGSAPDAASPLDMTVVERTCGSLALDGNSSSALQVDTTVLALSNPSTMTAEAWIYVTAYPSAKVQIVGHGNNSDGSTKSWALWLRPDGRPVFEVVTSTSGLHASTANNPIGTFQWTHVAGVWDQASPRIAVTVDGAFYSVPGENQPPVANAEGITIGNALAGTTAKPFVGMIDEVRISKVARYTTDFFTVKHFDLVDSDTLLLLHLDEASGTVAIDATTGHNDGTLEGNAQFAASCVPVRCNYLLSNSTSTAAATASVGKLDPTGSFTVEAWVQPFANNTGTYVNLLDYGDYPSHRTYHLFMQVAGMHPGFETSCVGTAWDTALGPAIPAYKWTHLAGVFDGSNTSLYVDGRLAAQAAVSCSQIFAWTAPLAVASTFASNAPMLGYVDELRISSVARYSGTFTPATSFTSDSDTLALYHFDESAGAMTAADSAPSPAPMAVGGGEIWDQCD